MKSSVRAKLIAIALLAVLLPIVILSVMQYRSLVDLQHKTKAASQESLRQVLHGLTWKVREDFRNLARESFSSIDPQQVSGKRLDELEGKLAVIRQQHPQITEVFVSATCQCPGDRFALLHDGVKSERVLFAQSPKGPGAQHEQQPGTQRAEQILNEYHQASSSQLTIDPGTDAFFWQSAAARPTLRVFYPLRVAGQSPLFFGGFTLNSDFLQKEYLPQIIGNLMADQGSGSEESRLAVGLFDDRDAEVYSTEPGKNNYEINTPFTPVLPKWRLMIGYKGTTVEALARDNFHRTLALTAFVLFLLAVGITLILHATTREVRLAETKSAFVSNVSHELKTPLALIRLFGEMLELGMVKSPEKAQEYYRIITAESRRLTQLINNILDFSKIEAGRKQYQLTQSDVAGVVEEVLGIYKHQLGNAGFDVNANIGRNLPPALIDADAIAQATLNLIDNAVKYSTEVKKIDVQVFRQGSDIAIQVADSGIGIPRSEQDRIFEKFYRVSDGLVHQTRGSGLGLTVVKHIVEAHQGRILIESSPGSGSCFTILLPVAVPELAGESGAMAGRGVTIAESINH